MLISTLLKRRAAAFPVLVAACAWLMPVAPASAQKASSKAKPAQLTGQVAEPTANQPWQFVQNRNQWPAQVLFAVDVPMGRLFLEKNRLTHSLLDVQALEQKHHHPEKKHRINGHAYAVNFVGANAEPQVLAGNKSFTQYNFFLGNDPKKWATSVPAFADVRYKNLYPGTDLLVYGRPDALEYDFELAVGADPKRIQLRYDGADNLSLNADGALRIATTVGNVVEQKPYAYQVVKGQKQQVACEFRLSGNTVSFVLPQGYNKRQPLVIDPVLVYSTYSGSSAGNWGYTATYDSLGNLYAGGIVSASGYPVTLGAYDATHNGGWDMGIMKFDPKATTGAASRVYVTYVGSDEDDHPHSMVVDHAGNLVIMGTTEEPSGTSNYPTTATAYDRSYNGGNSDIVVTKLSPGGNSLVASTFLGGNDTDGQNESGDALNENYGDSYRGDVTVDKQNNVYIASVTMSSNFPRVGGFQNYGGGDKDGVVVKLNPNLTNLVWSSFLGGSDSDVAYSVQVDSVSNVFVSGGTISRNFPGTFGSYQSGYRGGSADGFVARINAAGSSLVRATYLGTGSYDQAHFVQLDRAGNVYLFGQTSGSYPVSNGAYANFNSRLFIHKLNATLTSSLMSTTVGNGNVQGLVSPTAFLVDNCGQILLSGWGGGSLGSGSITGMPRTPDALPINATSSGDYFYIMQLGVNASRLVYGTYFGNGSSHVDGGTSRFDKKGIIYQSMCNGTGGTRITTTPNAYSTGGSASYNNAAFKMDVLQLSPEFIPSNSPAGPRAASGCAPFRVYFRRPMVSGTGVQWDFGNGQTSSVSGTVSTVYNQPGRYPVKLTVFDTNSCLQSVSRVDTVVVLAAPQVNLGADRDICPGDTAIISATPAGLAVPGTTYTWTPATGLNVTSGVSVLANPAVTTTYIVRASNTVCESTDTVVVKVGVKPQITVGANTTNAFIQKPVVFTNTTQGATRFSWDFADGQTSTETAPTHTFERPGSYRVMLTAFYGNGCSETQELLIEVRRFDLPNIITPNGDGKNDTFKPFVSFQPVEIKIFNRWGKKVYEKSSYTDGWGDSSTPPGTYYYTLTDASGETWKGWVEVSR
ncbi:PKD domain-containing protein [Hymenobacter sp. B81]|uniref:DUF7948 domain-containing protein n=1 Tax=Hymenobacter sp. B81 TaxID=3344878 RepID=UPI0037DC346E